MYASTIKAQKDGRQVAARRLDAVVLCPTSSFAFSPSANRPFWHSPLRRRSWLRTWRGRRGGQAVRLRCSHHTCEDSIVAGINPRPAVTSATLFCQPRHDRAGRHRALVLLICSDFSLSAHDVQGIIVFLRILNQVFDLLFGLIPLFHFLFSFRPGVGLSLSSAVTIPNRLAIVNRKNENIFTGAEAPTQNPRLDRRLRKAPSTNSITPFPPSAPGRAQPGVKINPRIHRTS
jgi:hypothetical protein